MELRKAILGDGQISRAHVAALKCVKETRIIAIADRGEGRARAIAELAGGVNAYSYLAILLQEGRPDTVHVEHDYSQSQKA